ncbi:hypothetical protein [Maribellus mangrovi]|uniref:hypothetical protein n=1 Tax=Maribellus mangrovi TaxID=3133146 RepID=UPI0030EBC07B
MKKLKILTIPVILGCIVFLVACNNQPSIQEKLIGTWQLCNPDGTVTTNLYDSEDMSRYKLITKETFMVMDFTNKSQQILGVINGTFTVENGVYNESIQYTNANFRGYLNKMNSFTIEIKKDYMFIKGTNNDLDEIWKKVKD